MPERLALVVSSTEELRGSLGKILKGGENLEGVYRGHVKNTESDSRSLDNHAEQKDLSGLAELWVSGTKLDWRPLYKSGMPNRIPLPTYPFARERCWVASPAGRTNTAQPNDSNRPKEPGRENRTEGSLESLVPAWNPVRFEGSRQSLPLESAKVLLLGGDQTCLDWLKESYPSAENLTLEATSSVDAIESVLADCLFDELVWVAPDVAPNTCYRTESSGLIIEQQEQGVLAIFRIIKALMQMGYANKELKWTIITRRTQLVTADDEILPGHAAVSGLIGCLAKECPRWNLRLSDLDSLSVAATECLTLPWDKQGNVLAYRRNGWFQQGLAPTSIRSQTAPVYRKHGVYVVIGGAGGLGEVWTRFMIEHYQAKVVWIGRRPYDGSIKEKINLLAGLGPAPLYISADATNLDALEEAGRAILKAHPAIHGVVQSAIVLRDQSLADMEESEFRTSLSAKVDVSVNMDRVFGKLELDFMLFFSSILSFFKTPRQANYAAGCTFKDSFARKLQLERAYPVKVMNWGYWGSVGVVARESYRQTMRQLGVGSIDPQEGMELLQEFVNCDLTQVAVIKTLSRDITAGLMVAQPDTKSDSLLRQ